MFKTNDMPCVGVYFPILQIRCSCYTSFQLSHSASHNSVYTFGKATELPCRQLVASPQLNYTTRHGRHQVICQALPPLLLTEFFFLTLRHAYRSIISKPRNWSHTIPPQNSAPPAHPWKCHRQNGTGEMPSGTRSPPTIWQRQRSMNIFRVFLGGLTFIQEQDSLTFVTMYLLTSVVALNGPLSILDSSEIDKGTFSAWPSMS